MKKIIFVIFVIFIGCGSPDSGSDTNQSNITKDASDDASVQDVMIFNNSKWGETRWN